MLRTWHGMHNQDLDDGVIHVHIVLPADGRQRPLHCDLHACFPAGLATGGWLRWAGYGGLATGMSQPTFVMTLPMEKVAVLLTYVTVCMAVKQKTVFVLY